ncbi:hypothetical protein JCM5353_000257 [Sporobolomyces roseus]
MTQAPVRVLILLDGDNVAPEKSYLTARAQGGSLSAFQLAEQARRWISTELGRDASISCLLFADVAHLSRSMDLSSEGTLAFSKGFSSTPSPCAFVHVLQGTTLAAISAHLAFLLPTIDYLFLGGFSTEIHAYHILKTLKSSTTKVPKIVLLSTTQAPVQSMSNLAHSTTRFSGISEVVHQRVETILTNPHHEFSDGYQASSPTTSSIASPVVGTRAPATRMPALPGSEEDTNPWLTAESSTRAQTSVPPRRQSVQIQSPAPYPPGLILPTGMVQPAPSNEAAVESVRDPKKTSPILSQLLTTTASPPPSTPLPSSQPSSTPTPVQQAPIGTPSPSATSKSASSPSTTSASMSRSPSTSLAPIESPQPRAPTIPSRFLPLLRLIHSHSIESPIAPLWSTIGGELPKSSYPKSIKFKEYLMEAQKEGWVVTGKGEGEGREWVKISKRGERALAKSENQ